MISTATGNRVAALNAEHLLRDEQATVVSVCEFPCQGRARLLVGINGSAEEGMVGLLDVPSSMLIRAVEIPFQVILVGCATPLQHASVLQGCIFGVNYKCCHTY